MADDYDDQNSLPADAEQAVGQAAPEEVDAHRGLLGEVMGHLGGQGVDVPGLLGQAGVSTTDPSQMSHSDLVSSTLALAQAHPEVMAQIAQRFPQAQGLLGSVLGGAAGGGRSGGMLGGLMGRLGL